jgi:tetratricopeptide (TPR) repeat protein
LIGSAKQLYDLAKLKHKEAEYAAGDHFLDEAIAIYKDIGDYGWQSRCLHLKGQAYFTRGKPDKAIEIFLIALETANKSADIKQQKHLLSALGNFCLEIKKNPDEAKKGSVLGKRIIGRLCRFHGKFGTYRKR